MNFIKNLRLAFLRLFREFRELEAQATTDSLTGLLNRRGALTQLRLLLGQSARQSKQPRDLTTFVIDLDNFKLVNDQFGHEAGDQVLRFVAEVLRRTFRSNDILVRPGGDEFIVYLIEAGRQGAIARARKLIQKLDEAPELQFGPITVTASIGVSHGIFRSREGGLQIAAKMVELADQAMYEAKQTPEGMSGLVEAPDAVFSDTHQSSTTE